MTIIYYLSKMVMFILYYLYSSTKLQIVMSTVSVMDMMSMPVEPEMTMTVMLKTDEVVALLDSMMKDF